MQRVEANADWSLFCPNEAPGLADCWGDDHAALYLRYEQEGRAKKVIKAQQLWFAIMEAQVSTVSYILLSIVTVVSPIAGSLQALSVLLCAGGDGQSVHAVQGLVQSQVQSAESRDDQMQQLVHRDC